MSEQRNRTQSARERLLMDPAWRFHLGDVTFPVPATHNETYLWSKAGAAQGAANPDYDDSEWSQVDIPHDWVVEGEVDPEANLSHGFLPTGIGWYRKRFAIPAEDEGKRLIIEFDGVFRNSAVWLNGHKLGCHLSGYTSFAYDISEVASYGGENVVAVRVDATEVEGWWYEGGGIYRHVWLTKTNPLHIARWGTFVTSEVSDAGAELCIQTLLCNEHDHDLACTLDSEIEDGAARAVAQARSEQVIPAGTTVEIVHRVTVDDPRLWSVDSPHLYQLRSVVSVDGIVRDDLPTVFGIRTMRFDPEQGFFLNGKHLKLKGTCNHQDHAGVGTALPDRLNEYRIERLKEMGCNAYRCAHNPPTPELLDACDRLGMLVMDENRSLDCSEEGLSQLRDLILRDRNHPSVILWSLANEESIQGTKAGARILRKMIRLAKSLDPTRPITAAMNGAWETEFGQIQDVLGCNYAHGNYDQYHRDHPLHPILGSETGSTFSTRGVYETDPDAGYLSAYDVNFPPWGATAEAAWLAIVERPFMAGTFVWTGFDYRGEPSPYTWPCVNSHFGILDLCGLPKDNYYYYKSWWSDETVLHILPHWNWPGREGQEIDVWCHSNCDSVELILNGASLGTKDMPRNSHLEWKVTYAPGVLQAKGYRGGEVVAVKEVTTAGPAFGIRLTADRSSVNSDGEDVAVVLAEITDEHGSLVSTADGQLAFGISGPGKIIGVGNGDPSSHEPSKAESRRAFSGQCVVIVQSLRQPGVIEVTAHSPGLQAACITVAGVSCSPRPFVPSIETGSLAKVWRLSPVIEDVPSPDLKPQDFDQNSWTTVIAGDGAKQIVFDKPGYMVCRTEAVVPPHDPTRESIRLQFRSMEGNATIFVNGAAALYIGAGNAPVITLDNVQPREPLTLSIVLEGHKLAGGMIGPVAFQRVPKL